MRVFKIFKMINLIILCTLMLNAQENRLFWDGREWIKIRKDADYDANIEYKIKIGKIGRFNIRRYKYTN